MFLFLSMHGIDVHCHFILMDDPDRIVEQSMKKIKDIGPQVEKLKKKLMKKNSSENSELTEEHIL